MRSFGRRRSKPSVGNCSAERQPDEGRAPTFKTNHGFKQNGTQTKGDPDMTIQTPIKTHVSFQIRAQRTLCDILVTTPVIQIHDPHPPDQYRKSRKTYIIGIVFFEDHMKVIVRRRRQYLKAVQ